VTYTAGMVHPKLRSATRLPTQGGTRPEHAWLVQAFGSELSKAEIEALYRQADTDDSNDVSEEELASYLVNAHKEGELSKVSTLA
jgi:hypothetical protein